jgi:hypothetical protein
MLPISAAMAEPVRPVTMNADSTGPSSRSKLNATAGIEFPEAVITLQAHHHAGKNAGQQHDRKGVDADGPYVVDDEVQTEGGTKCPGERREEKQKHPPHAGDSFECGPADMSDDRKHFG